MLKRFLKVISVPIAIILVLPLLIVCSITYIFIGKYAVYRGLCVLILENKSYELQKSNQQTPEY